MTEQTLLHGLLIDGCLHD